MTEHYDVPLERSVSVQNDMKHMHGDQPVQMSQVEESVDHAKLSQAYTAHRDTWVCRECDTTVQFTMTVVADSDKVDAALQAAAAGSHEPPDHFWIRDARPECPICAALDAASLTT